MRYLLILTTTLFLSSISSLATDSCSCGYQDPSNNLWTDSIITYFNESSSASDINFNSTTSPVPNEFANSSPSKVSGSQDWVAMDYENHWDTCWTCTFRHQIASNNTYVQDGSLNLAVQPADMINHISWGGEVITRRRDILYGSFRAALQAPAPAQGGSILEMTIAYNASDYLSTGIYSSDDPVNSTFQWSYSSRGHIAAPTKNPLFALGSDGFHEHRMDWMGSEGLRYSNDGTNASANFLDLERKRDHVNIPTLGGPLNFKHWSNGENSQSQGPPIHHQPVGKASVDKQGFDFSTRTHDADSVKATPFPIPFASHPQIQYVRMFFNSSLPSRHSEFQQQCSAAPVPLCSTEDGSLRGSTPFSLESTGRILASPQETDEKLYAIISASVSGGVFLLLFLHALVKRKGKGKDSLSREQQYQGQTSEFDELDDVMEQDKAALKIWDDPSKLVCHYASDFDSVSEDSEDESDPFDDPFYQSQTRKDLFSFGDGVFDNNGNGGSSSRSLPYSAPSFHMVRDHSLTPIGGSQTPGSFHGSFRSSGGNHLQGIEDKLLALKEDEISPSFSSGPLLSPIQRRPSDLSILSITRDPNKGGFSYSSTSYTQESLSSARLGSMNEFPAAESSTWHGGLLGGIGQVDQTDRTLTSASQTRLLPRRPSAYLHGNGEEPAPITWNPVIVEWKPQKPNDDELQLAQRADGVAQLPQAPAADPVKGISGWIGRFAKKMLVGEGAGGMTASGAAKVEYLDGLRGFACFLVSFHHFMLIFYYNVTTPTGPAHYPEMERWLRNLLGSILTNGGLNVGIFFCLAARVIANRYLVRGRLQDLAEATQRRVPRLMVPISFAILLCYFLIEADAFHWIGRLSSRSWSVWSYYQNYDSFGTFIDSWVSLWFTDPPNVPSMISTYATGILWTVPLIVSASWTVFTCALIAYEIPNVKKRYSFYFVCWLVSWYALRFDYFFIAGLVIADLDNKVKYRALAAKGFPLFPSFISSRLPSSFAKKRIHGQVFAWAIFLTGAIVSWLDQVNGTGSDLPTRELGIHPHWQTAQPRAWIPGNLKNYTDPRIFDFFFVIGFFLLCDLCSSFRTFFQLRIWSALGRNAFSLYLLHGVIFWSWGAWICLHLLAYGLPYWAAVLVTFITSYIWLAMLCEFFTRTFDKWGVSLSKSFWRECSGGLGRRA